MVQVQPRSRSRRLTFSLSPLESKLGLPPLFMRLRHFGCECLTMSHYSWRSLREPHYMCRLAMRDLNLRDLVQAEVQAEGLHWAIITSCLNSVAALAVCIAAAG